MRGGTVSDGRVHALSCAAIVLLALCLLVAGVQALTVPVSDADRVADADEIVRGTISETQSRWNEDHTHIETTATVRVESRPKGEGSDTVTCAVLGGTADGFTEWVEDEPVLVPGKEAYVFVKRDSSTDLSVPGRVRALVPISNGRVSGLSPKKDSGIPVADYDRYLRKLAQGQAVARPAVIESSNPAPRALAATPVISSVGPNIGSAGTGTIVTITGTGFGTKASRESMADVEFLYLYDGSTTTTICASGWPYFGDNADDIVSWTDTEIVCRIPTGYTMDGYPGSASSGWLHVLTDANELSSDWPFTVTFGYGRMKRIAPAEYYVNPGTLGSDAVTAVTSAGTTWNAAIPASSFRFTCLGASSSTAFGRDGESLICFRPASDFQSSDIIAQANSFTDSNGNIVETDIRFNQGFAWTTGTATGSQESVQTIALHELGHWLQLRDLYGWVPGYPSDVGKVMFGYIGASFGNQNLKTLSANDIAGIRWIYSDSTTPTPTVTETPIPTPTVTPTPTPTTTVTATPTPTTTVTVTPTPISAVVAVPGGAGVPTDTNGDGLYDDVNGNGRRDFADVVLYFNQVTWIVANEPVGFFDYNGNGRIDFDDVVWLFDHL
jgi:PKD repeat protein